VEEYTPLTCTDGAVIIRHFSSFFVDVDRARAPGVVARSWDDQARTFTLAQCGLPDQVVARPWEDPELDLAIVAFPSSADWFDDLDGTFDYTLMTLRAGKSWTRDHELVELMPARWLAHGRRDDT
jgi:hypothetical protein